MNVNNYTSLLNTINDKNIEQYIGFEESQSTQGKKVEGGKNLVLKDIKNAENVGDDLKNAGRDLRNDLVNSLKSYGAHVSYMDKLYEKLGIKKDEQDLNTPKALTAREFKDAVAVLEEAKSAREQEIKRLLSNFQGGGFPDEKADFLTKAMLAHSDDSRVAAFLKQPGGNTLMNLVAVCRMALETKDSNANIYTVAYFEGYTSFFAGRMTDEERELAHTKQEREAGRELAQKHDEAAGHPQQVSESQQSPNTQQVQTESGTSEILAPRVNPQNCDQELEGLLKDLLPEGVKGVLDSFEKRIADLDNAIKGAVSSDCVADSLEVVRNYCKQMAVYNLNNLRNELKKESKNSEKLTQQAVLERMVKDVNADDAVMYVLLKDAIEANKDHPAFKFPWLKERVDHMLDVKSPENDDDPHAGDFFNFRQILYKEEKVFGKQFNLRERLSQLLNAYCVEGKKPNLEEVVLQEPTFDTMAGKVDKNVIVKQAEGSNLCYMRAPINALIGKGVRLEDVCHPKGDGFTFKLPDPVLGTTVREISVTKDEIDAMWRAQCEQHPGAKPETTMSSSKTEFVRGSFSSLDLALCVATAKMNALQKNDSIDKGRAPTFIYPDNSSKSLVAYIPWMCSFNEANDAMELFGFSPYGDKLLFNQFIGYDKKNPEAGLRYFKRSETSKSRLKTWVDLNAWKNRNPNDIMIVNKGGNHFIAVTDLYYENDNNFGMICRDSSGNNGQQTINLATADEMYAVTCYRNSSKLDLNAKMQKYSERDFILLDALKGKTIDEKLALLFDDGESFKQFKSLVKDNFKMLGVPNKNSATFVSNLLSALGALASQDGKAKDVIDLCKRQISLNKLLSPQSYKASCSKDDVYEAISGVIKCVMENTPDEQLATLAKCHALMLVHFGVDDYRVV